MPIATIALIEQLLTLLVTYGPELAQEVSLAVSLLKSGTDPTPEQQAQIDAALDKASAALQAAVAAKVTT